MNVFSAVALGTRRSPLLPNSPRVTPDLPKFLHHFSSHEIAIQDLLLPLHPFPELYDA